MEMHSQFGRLWIRTALLVWVMSAVGALFGSEPAIGMAMANGSFEVDHSRVWGTATLFDGSTIETPAASAQLKLDGGAEMRLAPDTRVRVHRQKLVLESGYGQVSSAPGFEVEARSLHVLTTASGTVTRIRVEGERKVLVAAVRGSVRVSNSAGMLVANVEEGASLDFEPQVAGASAPTHAVGCLLALSGKLIVAEETTHVILELQGSGLEPEVGNRVQITGIAETSHATVPDASEVVKVLGLKEVSKGGCSAVARKLGATATTATATSTSGAATAPTSSESSTATGGGAGAGGGGGGVAAGTVAVIGGVAAAATVGGLAAAGALPGQSNSPPSASR